MNQQSYLFDQDYEDLESGASATALQAGKLESSLEKDPFDISKRLRLIGYYRRKTGDSISFRLAHLIWMIDHHPKRSVWRHQILMGLDDNYSPKMFGLAREHWLHQLNSHPDDCDILGNAGLFLIQRDFEEGDRLLTKAIELNPQDDYLPNILSRECYWQMKSGLHTHRRRFASKALTAGQQFLHNYGSDGGRAISALRERGLTLCAHCALIIGDTEAAQYYAQQQVDVVKTWSSQPKAGRSILGFLALKAGKQKLAVQQLLHLHAETRPDELDLLLANALLKEDNFAAVIDYLRTCKKFGFWSKCDVDSWIALLSRGRKIQLK